MGFCDYDFQQIDWLCDESIKIKRNLENKALCEEYYIFIDKKDYLYKIKAFIIIGDKEGYTSFCFNEGCQFWVDEKSSRNMVMEMLNYYDDLNIVKRNNV